jgi:hypothetical protein
MAGGTLLYQWKRKDIRPSQKIINARLSSQVLALVGVGAMAGNRSISFQLVIRFCN